jgi:hypothetical protein
MCRTQLWTRRKQGSVFIYQNLTHERLNGRIPVYRVQVSMPSGAVSIGVIRKDEEGAQKAYSAYVRQVRAMPYFTADVILSEDGVELQREHISNAA